jgi:PAS domain S-box-containing protein
MSDSTSGVAEPSPATALPDLAHVRAVADLLPHLAWSCRPDGHCDYLSRRWVEYTGVPEARHHGRGWLAAVHPDDRDRTGAAWAAFVAGRGEYDIDYRLRRHDGVYRWFKTRGALATDAAGRPVRVFGTTTDVDDQKRADDRFRALVTTTADVVYRMSADWSVMYPLDGRGLVRSTDRPIRDWLEANIPAFEHPRVRAAVERAIRTREPFELEHQVFRPDGSLGWTHSRAVAVLGPAGEVVEWFGAATDVTARKLAEARFRSVFEAMDEGFCLVEPVFDAAGRPVDYRYLLANPALERHTGLKDVVGRTARQVMPGHEQDWVDGYARVALTGEPFRREGGVEDLGRWYEVVAFRVGDPSLRQVGVLFADVTARHRAEEAVRASERQLADVFRHAPSFMAVLRGPDHVFERANDGYAALVSRRPLLGRPVRDAIPEVVRQGFVDLLDRVYRTGEPFVGQATLAVLDPGDGRPPEERILDFVYQPLRDAAGAVTGVLVHGIDLTDRVRAEERLREADRRKDEFLAVLAHELRNPLAPIRNGLQVIRLAGDDPAAVRTAREMMDRQLTHLVRLVDDLLDVSRITRGKLDLRRERILLSDAVAAAVEAARPALDAAGHALALSVPPAPVYLDGDLTRLAQVLGNLLTNAAKYTPPGGRVWLTAEPTATMAVVRVRDTGIGIPADALPTVFDMFSQIDRPLERTTGGLGIGLALVRGLVELHGGSVTAESEGEGTGSTFTIRLPLAEYQPPPAMPADADAVPTAGPGRRILVVDDNRDAALSTAEMLRLLGHEVATAHDGRAGLAAAAAFRPEVVLMDVGMPGMNGLDATRELRATPWGRAATVIALTGWGQEADRERSRAAGCDGHLVKPVHLQDLLPLLAVPPADPAPLRP